MENFSFKKFKVDIRAEKALLSTKTNFYNVLLSECIVDEPVQQASSVSVLIFVKTFMIFI